MKSVLDVASSWHDCSGGIVHSTSKDVCESVIRSAHRYTLQVVLRHCTDTHTRYLSSKGGVP